MSGRSGSDRPTDKANYIGVVRNILKPLFNVEVKGRTPVPSFIPQGALKKFNLLDLWTNAPS